MLEPTAGTSARSDQRTVLGVLASPHGGGHTATALEAFLRGCATVGARTELVDVSKVPAGEVVAMIDRADGVVFGSPTYRATHTALLSGLLEQIDHRIPGTKTAPLSGKAAAVVMTGAAAEHFLATERLQLILSSFFAAQVLAPCLYFAGDVFTPQRTLRGDADERAQLHGRALVDLVAACSASSALSALRPLV